MNLAENHLANLRASLISDAVIASREYRTVTTPDELKAFGFSKVQQQLVPAMLIPVWDVHGGKVLHHIRPDFPRANAKGKLAKYEFTAGCHMDIDVPPLARSKIGDPNVPLWITEGSKKADSAVSIGLCCVSVIGVWNWRGTNAAGGKTVLAAWESVALNERLVYLAFDSDAMYKKEVYQALIRFKEFLKSRGARVRIVYLPDAPNGAKTGLDDFFARGGTPDEAIRTAKNELDAPRAPERLPGEDEEEIAAAKLGLTDLGNAKRLVKKHGKDIRYCPAWSSWMVWDGRRWERDATKEIDRRARTVVNELYVEAGKQKSLDERKKVYEHAIKSESRRALEAISAVAQAEAGIAVSVAQFDKNEWLLSVRNGTVDLRTGRLLPHNRDDLITKFSPASFDPEATCPTWDRFLSRIMADREDLVAFIRRAAGYSLTGSTREQAMFFCYGDGANGKSTLIEALRYVLGDYAMAAQFDTFMANDNRGDAREDIARLRGARLVSAVEGAEGRKFDEAVVKQLTGGDTVTARFLFEGSFEFVPTCKIWLAANHKPKIRGADDGIWRRMRLVPFDVKIPEAERDNALPELLRSEADGILAWCVRGALEWQTHGLGTPLVVTEATQEYREESDDVGLFLSEACETLPGGNIQARDLYNAYKNWSEKAGVRPVNGKTFGSGMKNRREVTFVRDRNKVVWYQGLRIRCG